ncbi:hypothetical protein E4T39_03365 [Aureobasidium subglaciale]|nr:hypothetical protein E4T39_03365 [Aureobasidium subglaciale]
MRDEEGTKVCEDNDRDINIGAWFRSSVGSHEAQMSPTVQLTQRLTPVNLVPQVGSCRLAASFRVSNGRLAGFIVIEFCGHGNDHGVRGFLRCFFLIGPCEKKWQHARHIYPTLSHRGCSKRYELQSSLRLLTLNFVHFSGLHFDSRIVCDWIIRKHTHADVRRQAIGASQLSVSSMSMGRY